jgi:thymidylate synthase
MTATEGWERLLRDVLRYGVLHKPRELETLELLNYSSVVNMEFPIVTSPARKLGYRFMVAEALWILEGRNDVESIVRFAPAIAQFSDDGKTFFGAYGPKVRDQLSYVCNKLASDPSTRQAVMTIWRENPRPSKDFPCTVSVQWLIRDGFLHCVDTMRSSDVWLGWPYDVFNFSMLSLLIGLILREAGLTVKLGQLYLNAGSQHIYFKDMGKARNVLGETFKTPGTRFQVSGFSNPKWFLAVLADIRDSKKGVLR